MNMVFLVCVVGLCMLLQCTAGPVKQQRLDNDTARSVDNLTAKPQVYNAINAAQSSNVVAKPQVVEGPLASPLTNVEERPQLVAHHTTIDEEQGTAHKARPQVIHNAPHVVSHSQEKPHVIHSASQELSSNLPAKPQVINISPGSLENVQEKPQVVHATGAQESDHIEPKRQVVEGLTGRRLPTSPKDTASSVQERPQVPHKVARPPRPYGEKETIPQIPPFPPKRPPPIQERPQIQWAQRPKQKTPLSSPLTRQPAGYPIGRVQVPPTRPPPGCFYKGERYEQGDSVPTAEPCLNCTCQRGVLACFLRVCPVLGTQVPGCFSAREPGECCPKVYCSAPAKEETTTYADYQDSDYENSFASAEEELSARTPPEPPEMALETEKTKLQDEEHSTTQPSSTQAQTTSPTTQQTQAASSESTTERIYAAAEDPAHVNSVEEDHGRDSVMFVSSTPLPYEESFDLQDLNSISGACLTEGSLYAEGSAMLSTDYCSYCYCIRSIKHCVQPKCHLTVDNCEPQFSSKYHCCPSSYACSLNDTTTTSPTTPSTTTTTASTTRATTTTFTSSTAAHVTIPIQGCWRKGQLYRVGEAIPSGTECEACYCSPSGPTCHRIECPQVALDCEPIIHKGHCCPTKYICNKTTPTEARKPVFEVFNSKVSRDPQLRKSDVVDPDAPMATTTQETTESPQTTTAAILDTSATVTENNFVHNTTAHSKKQHVIYVPELVRTEDGGKMMTELKIVMNPASKEYHDEQVLYPREPIKEAESKEHQFLPPVPLEGLQFSDLIDRLFFTSKDESTELAQQNDKLQPVYSEPLPYNATGTSIVETRVPVSENDALRPIYGDPLEAKYGNGPPVVEDTAVETESTPRYEAAIPLDFNTTSEGPVYAIALAEDEDVKVVTDKVVTSGTPLQHDGEKSEGNETVRLHESQGDSSFQNLTLFSNSTEHHEDEKEPEVPTESSTMSIVSESLERSGADPDTYPTSNRTAVNTAEGTDRINLTSSKNTVTSTQPSTTLSVLEGTTSDNDSFSNITEEPRVAPDLANEVNMTTVSNKSRKVLTNTTSEDGITTKVIKVKVGNVLNVTDTDIEATAVGRQRLRNIEEDGVIIGTFHGDHLTDSSELIPSHIAESRAIASDGPASNVHIIATKVKSLVRPQKLVKGDGEPEVITAANIDFSDGGSISIALSPSNSFKVSVGFSEPNTTMHDDTTQHMTVNVTAPPVDTAPWAPLPTNLAEESVTSSTTAADESEGTTEESKQHSVVHSSFRIVPFLAEDAIFKPSDTNQTHSPALIRVKSNPREPVKDNCFVGGRMFVNGELIKKNDPCDLCRCYYGEELCQKKTCPPPPSPACFTERVTGFCCPKYTCRPEDVGFPPTKQNVAVTTEKPATTSRSIYDRTTTQKPAEPSLLKKMPFLKTFFSRTSSTWTPIKISETTTTPWTPETLPTTTIALDHRASNSAWNLLQVSGCNIYGRLYSVNEVIPELSSNCKACTCTALGVQCNDTC